VLDPLTIFAGIKAGIAAGKEIQSMAADLASLWDSIDSIRDEHNKKKSSPFRGSVNEEALDTFIKKKQAEDAEEQLREIIISTRGHGAWQELLKLRGQIRKERQEQERLERIARRRKTEQVTVGAILIAAMSAAGALVHFLLAKLRG